MNKYFGFLRALQEEVNKLNDNKLRYHGLKRKRMESEIAFHRQQIEYLKAFIDPMTQQFRKELREFTIAFFYCAKSKYNSVKDGKDPDKAYDRLRKELVRALEKMPIPKR